MKKVILKGEVVWFLDQMLRSCGNRGCDLSLGQLLTSGIDRPLSDFAPNGHWLRPVFGNLQAYALSEGMNELGLSEVVRYFGGPHHIELMVRKAFRSSLGIEMGLAAGLVLDVLLPIAEDGVYRNGKLEISLGDFVEANPNDAGLPFYHRGLVVRLPVSRADVEFVLKAQQDSSHFVDALAKLASPVHLPTSYLEALKLSVTS